jgi:hypothetical protein
VAAGEFDGVHVEDVASWRDQVGVTTSSSVQMIEVSSQSGHWSRGQVSRVVVQTWVRRRGAAQATVSGGQAW